MQVDTCCKLCSKGSESIEHVLFKCDVAQEAWENAGLAPIANLDNSNLVELLDMSCLKMFDASVPVMQRRAIPWIVWIIWKNINSILYADTQMSMISQLQQAKEE